MTSSYIYFIPFGNLCVCTFYRYIYPTTTRKVSCFSERTKITHTIWYIDIIHLYLYLYTIQTHKMSLLNLFRNEKISFFFIKFCWAYTRDHVIDWYKILYKFIVRRCKLYGKSLFMSIPYRPSHSFTIWCHSTSLIVTQEKSVSVIVCMHHGWWWVVIYNLK